MSRGQRRTLVAVGFVAAVLAVGVGNSVASSTSASATPGVTNRLITLGVNVAQSGLAAPTTVAFVQGIQTFWFGQNSRGGVCNHQVKLAYGDNGGDPQKGIGVYTQMKDSVLGFQQLSPTSVLTALADQVTADNMLVSGSSTISALFSKASYVPVVADYGNAYINVIDWLMRARGVQRGDTIGYLYGVGAFAEDGKRGVQFMADARGLKVVYQQVPATQPDMSGPMIAMERAGVKAVLANALTPQTLNAVASAESINFKPTFVGSTFQASALDTSLKAALTSGRVFILGNGGGPTAASLLSPAPGVKRAVADYTKFFHKPPSEPAMIYGYAQSYVFAQILKAACANPANPKKPKALTRASVVAAFKKIRNMDTEGILPPLNYSLTGLPPTRAIFMSRVDATAQGGLRPITGYFQAPEGARYKPVG
jgi:ABC-type branched-subunit amino acid transport system substrate-binding protein